MFIEIKYDDGDKRILNTDNLIDIYQRTVRHSIYEGSYRITIMTVKENIKLGYETKAESNSFYQDMRNALSGCRTEMVSGMVEVLK